MFSLLREVKSFIKGNSARIDNVFFAFHYRTTVLILMAFSLIISSRKYFGDPISCTASTQAIKPIVNNFCWFNSYIIVPKDPEKGYGGGVEEHNLFKPVISTGHNLEKLRSPNSEYRPYFLHAYQWIEFILCLQAVLFYFPRYLWRRCWEQGRVKAVAEELSLAKLEQDDAQKKCVNVVRFMHRNEFRHSEYAWKYVFCEFLNFVNVLTQFRVLRWTMGITWDVLLHDFFSSSSNVNPESPLNLVFPNLARCEVPIPTGAGHPNSLELCVLPVNVFTTKMFIFLWFYFAALSVATGISLIYRVATIRSSQFRRFLMKRAGLATRNADGLKYGEWFLLTLIAKNADPFSYKMLVEEYLSNLSGHKEDSSSVGSHATYEAVDLQRNGHDEADKKCLFA